MEELGCPNCGKAPKASISWGLRLSQSLLQLMQAVPFAAILPICTQESFGMFASAERAILVVSAVATGLLGAFLLSKQRDSEAGRIAWKHRIPLAYLAAGVVIVNIGWLAYNDQAAADRFNKKRIILANNQVRNQAIGKAVEELLAEKLRALPDSDPIVQCFGKFTRLNTGRCESDFIWGNLERMYFSASAEFEKAVAPVILDVQGGTREIQRLVVRFNDRIEGNATYPGAP